jgi:hypothetical protein
LCRLIFHLPIFLLCLHRTRKQPWWPFFAIVAFQGVPGQKVCAPDIGRANARIL